MKTLALFLSSTSILATACLDEETPERVTDEPAAVAPTHHQICGDNTVASALAPSGNRVVFCVVDDMELIAEGGTAARLPIDSHACGLDLFLALTDTSTPVPARLFAACAARSAAPLVVARPIVAAPVFAAPDVDIALYSSSGAALDYCGVGGQLKFQEQNFEPHCEDRDECVFWNRNNFMTTDVKSSDVEMGEQVNIAESTVASCYGSTRFRAQRDRGAQDNGYVTLVDVDVPARWSWYLSMVYSTGGQDAHFKFRYDSYGSAKHMHAGRFEDDKGSL